MKYRRARPKVVEMEDFPDWMTSGAPLKKQTHRRAKHKGMVWAFRKTGNQKPLTPMLQKNTYGLKCDQCGRTDKLTIHHKIPLLDGGTNHPDNVAVLCVACHSAMHGRRSDRGRDYTQPIIEEDDLK